MCHAQLDTPQTLRKPMQNQRNKFRQKYNVNITMPPPVYLCSRKFAKYSSFHWHFNYLSLPLVYFCIHNFRDYLTQCTVMVKVLSCQKVFLVEQKHEKLKHKKSDTQQVQDLTYM